MGWVYNRALLRHQPQAEYTKLNQTLQSRIKEVDAIVFIVSQRRERRATNLLQKQFHRLNENEDLRPESTGSTPGSHGNKV